MSASNGTTILHVGPDGQALHLELQEVKVSALVVDVSAQITVSHIFYNPLEDDTGRAKYVFPKPASAAVCAFEMESEDGRVIMGEVKEAAEASSMYVAAVEQGKVAGLVEYATGDVFTISVGSIPAKTQVTTRLTCVMNLMNNDHPNEIRLQISMAVGPQRYGALPAGMVDAASATQATRLSITTKIQTSGIIRPEDVTSPSHGSAVRVSAHRTHQQEKSERRMVARFRSSTFLAQDFALVIKAQGLDLPRCFVESDPDGKGTIALQLVVVPKFKIPPMPAQEFLFLVDRSGSMSGERIAIAKSTLTVLLPALPNNGTKFNVYSFGNRCDSLWPQSVTYDQGMLHNTISRVGTMEANYGGTEIGLALRHVFANKDKAMPTVVFVLTDGEAYEIDSTAAIVSQAVAAAASKAPLRVFTLGIGNTASSAMCEAIARSGNGECLMAINTAEIIGKCARLVRLGRSSCVNDITIDWGIATTDLQQPDPAAPSETVAGIELSPPDAIQQTPPYIDKVYDNERFCLTAIIKTERIPDQVILSGRVDGYNEVFDLPVKVSQVRFPHTTSGVSLLHTLAAKSLIQDLQEHRGPRPTAVVIASEEQITKAAVVRLGVRYQLVSQHTSFVAVDEEERNRRMERERQERRQRQQAVREVNGQSAQSGRPGNDAASPATTTSSWGQLFQDKLGSILNMATWILGYASPSTTGGPPRRSRSPSPDHSSDGDGSSDELDPDPEGDRDDGFDSTATFSTMSTLESYDSDAPLPRRRRHRREPRRRSPSPAVRAKPPPPTDPAESTPGPQADIGRVVALARLQLFDGSFKPDGAFESIVGRRAMTPPAGLQVDAQVWATAVAAAFYERSLVGEKELLEGIMLKILEYVVNQGMTRTEFEGLVRQGLALLD